MVSTHLKNISQIGSFPQVGVKITNIWNQHLDDQTCPIGCPPFDLHIFRRYMNRFNKRYFPHPPQATASPPKERPEEWVPWPEHMQFFRIRTLYFWWRDAGHLGNSRIVLFPVNSFCDCSLAFPEFLGKIETPYIISVSDLTDLKRWNQTVISMLGAPAL